MPDINKAYTWAIQTCDAPNIEYSIPNRLKTINGITYYDCSSFIWKALQIGGFNTGSLWSTSDEPYERDGLIQAGFVQVEKSGVWMPGDVLLRTRAFSGAAYGHTEMVYEGGQGSGVIMGAHGRSNRAPADQVSVLRGSTSYASEWQYLFRYGNGATGMYGYSPYAVFALLGNCYGESEVNPITEEIGGTGIGLFQWSNTSDSDRRTRFLNWMNEQGYELSDGNAQLEYLLYEDTWMYKSAYPEFHSLTDFLTTDITDIDYLTEAFLRCWEVAGTERLNIRLNKAHQYAEYVPAHVNDTDIELPYKTTYGKDDHLYNAVLIYRYLTAGGGGGGIQTQDTTPPVFSQSNKGIVYSAIGRRREVIVQWR